jgi:hypothetical protein
MYQGGFELSKPANLRLLYSFDSKVALTGERII